MRERRRRQKGFELERPSSALLACEPRETAGERAKGEGQHESTRKKTSRSTSKRAVDNQICIIDIDNIIQP